MGRKGKGKVQTSNPSLPSPPLVNMGRKGKGKGQTSNPSLPSPPLVSRKGKGKGKGKGQTSNPSLPSPPLVNMGRKGKGKGQTSNPSLQGQTSNPSVPSPQLSDPMPISSGIMGTEYEVHKKHVITDPNTSYRMTYYEGIIIHKGKEHKKHRKDVCFLVRDNFDEAMRIFDLSGLISHPRVMKASSVFFDDFLNQYLVCFDKFEGLENAKKENSLAKKLNDPKLYATVPGNPGTFVQEEIKGLAEALDYMIQNHVSSSNLEWSYGYVWCPLTSHVKIMFADTSLKKEGNITRNPNEIIEATLKQFSNRLKEYFLKTSDDLKATETEEKPKDIIWPERGQFLNCFTRSKVPIQNRMKMAINHPFLKSSILEILRYFPTVNHAFKSEVSCQGHNMTKFRSALNNRTMWKIRGIRNKFEHRLKGEGSVRKLYEDIQGRDPLFIGELHEKEHYAFKSKVSCRGHNIRKFKSALNNRTTRKIRGIRNKFEHKLKDEDSVRKLYEDIQGGDPLFIGELHEKEPCAFKSKVSGRGHNMRKFRSALNNRTRRKIRGIQNKFEHKLKGEDSARKLYEDIQGRDPLFIGGLHEKEH